MYGQTIDFHFSKDLVLKLHRQKLTLTKIYDTAYIFRRHQCRGFITFSHWDSKKQHNLRYLHTTETFLNENPFFNFLSLCQSQKTIKQGILLVNTVFLIPWSQIFQRQTWETLEVQVVLTNWHTASFLINSWD